MQEDIDPSKGKGDGKEDQKKLKPPSSPKSRSPSPRPLSPRMAQLSVPEKQETFLTVSLNKRDSDISDSELQALSDAEKFRKCGTYSAAVERSRTPESPGPISDLAIHGSLNFRPPSPKPFLGKSSQGHRDLENRPLTPVENVDNPIFAKCSPRKSSISPKMDIPESSSQEDLGVLLDAILTSRAITPQLQVEHLSSESDSERGTIISSEIQQGSIQQSLSPDTDQPIGCFASLNPLKKSHSSTEKVTDGAGSGFPVDAPQRQHSPRSPKKMSPCKSLMLMPPGHSGTEASHTAGSTGLEVSQRSPQRSPSPIKDLLKALNLKTCMSGQKGLPSTEELSHGDSETPSNIPQQPPQKSPSSVKEQVSKFFGMKHRSSGAEKEPLGADTSLIPKRMVKSSLAKVRSSQHKTSSAEQESQSDHTSVLPKGPLRQSPDLRKQALGWNRSSSSSPSRLQAPFYRTIYLDRSLKTSAVGGYESDNAERPKSESSSGAKARPEDVQREKSSDHTDSSSDDEFFSQVHLAHMDRMKDLTGSNKSLWGIEKTSIILTDSEMAASCSTFSSDSVFESEKQESSLGRSEAQTPPVDETRQPSETLKQEKSSSETASPRDKDSFDDVHSSNK